MCLVCSASYLQSELVFFLFFLNRAVFSLAIVLGDMLSFFISSYRQPVRSPMHDIKVLIYLINYLLSFIARKWGNSSVRLKAA